MSILRPSTIADRPNSDILKNCLMQVSDASFSYDGQHNIFENINFSVEKGDVFCILGPNGTGKTTLIKCINGLMKLSSGKILFNEKNIYSLNKTEIAKNIGYIPQIHNSTFPFSVLDVVLMGRSPHLEMFASPGEKDIKIAEESLKTLKITHMRDVSYTEISGGEQQLVFLARILTQKPSILLLDEPTSHLDFGNQMRTLNIIEKLAKNGLSILMSSHFPDQAFISANKVALMKGKSFIDIGSPEEVITKENMEEIYNIKVKIVDIEHRKACIPLKVNGE
ncbi:MAG: ABC transporter ATP-binding protein [Methanobacteriaceae archaeon]|nr:ABC transporter ATP-binding protein [Methanobacteriaceae archaeon]MDP2836568.1 ABC transporter ATP-binding protein [Methanobacteriaceae archaeon]MDP3034921.1 ABC transporter ATP-binding protein [Methanobacteriaceae archaeon]MDP3485569.1 ABC transporter ATP-binding protein [Methanobacteriaceae archaeon]MDP3624631.1 ABC transporter ATP-binding protein [Methanobacteriaceae archaeon]